jgi:hypothetical protein
MSSPDESVELCATEFSVDVVHDKFKEQHPGYTIQGSWTQFLTVQDGSGNSYKVEYRVDDETSEPGFGKLEPILSGSQLENLLNDEELMVDSHDDNGEFEASYTLNKFLGLSRPTSEDVFTEKILRLAKAGVKAKKSADRPYGSVKYADPGFRDNRARYPLDTEAHCRAAWAYIHMPKNRKFYTAQQLKTIEGRIRAAAKKFGIELTD